MNGGVRIRMEKYIYDDYLEHYGIKGMRWGVRRTPEQLGHAVSHGRDAIAGFLSKTKKSIAKNVKQHDSEKLKKQKNAIKKVEAKNAQREKRIEMKQQMAAAKQRSRELKKMQHAPSSIEEAQKTAERQEKRAQRRAQTQEKIAQWKADKQEKRAQKKADEKERKRLDKLARQQAIRQAGSQLLTNTLVNVGNSAIKTAATSITNNDSYSESVRNFSEYMGGVKKQNDNSLDLLKTKSFNEMSDAELRSINDRFKTQMSIDSILKKEWQEYQSSQNGYPSSTTS